MIMESIQTAKELLTSGCLPAHFDPVKSLCWLVTSHFMELEQFCPIEFDWMYPFHDEA